MMSFRATLATALLLLLISCTVTEEREKFDLLITNATVIDVFTGDTIPSQLIGITDEVILTVDAQENADYYTGSEVIDAGGLYVMPGLWDMHVHFRGGDSLVSENRAMLPVFLQYGITSVRDAGGDMTPSVLEWRNQVNMRALDGPTIFTSGPKLDGEAPYWPGSIALDSAVQIKQAFDSLVAMGVDYVKTYASSLTAGVYYEIIREAEARQLPVTGHMPFDASIYHAIALGLDGTEHMYWVIKGASSDPDSLAALPVRAVYQALVPAFDPGKADSLYAIMAANHVTVTPTLHVSHTLSRLLETDHRQDSMLQVIGPGIRETYKRRVASAEQGGEAGARLRKDMARKSMEMIVPMYQAGVPLLAGSDCGPYNSYVYPGAGLHEELILMVEAGLTPREAIASSVINGPEFFGQQKYYGSVEQGKFADVIFLRKNPMRDIRNLQTIEMVVHKGKYYPRDSLNRLSASED